MSITSNFRVSSRNNNFDFIRFLAACSVIYSHSFDLLDLKNLEPLRVFSGNYISIGTLAVHIFFIISGFLIQQSFDRANDLSKYLVARILRILPALTVTSFTLVFLIGPLITTNSLSFYFGQYSTYKYLLNSLALKTFHFLPGVFEHNQSDSTVNGSIWSLPLEVMFYGLIALFGQYRRFKLVQFCLIILFIFLIWISIGFKMTGSIIYHAKFFVIGIIFYKFRKSINLNYILFLTSILFFFILLYQPIPVNKQLKDIILGISLSYSLFYLSYIKCKLNKFSRYGDFSYGIYIWAWPIQQIIIQQKPSITVTELILLTFPIVLSVAILSWHLIEKPMLTLKKMYQNMPIKTMPL